MLGGLFIAVTVLLRAASWDQSAIDGGAAGAPGSI